MFAAVIPAKNEEKSILAVLTNVLRLPVDYIIPVLNGCTDRTLELIQSIPDTRLHIIYFTESLGIDVPRAIGAVYARHLGVEGVLLVDGDMSGNIQANLAQLLAALASGTDMALTNCYPYITHRAKLAQIVLRFRQRLNRELDYLQTLGLSTPTHGPHALSARALSMIPSEAIAVPPLSLVWAHRTALSVKVATSISHEDLHSPRKHRRHTRLIAETIIGDCLMGLSLAQNRPLSRTTGHHNLLGYHPERRFDILQKWEHAVALENNYFGQHLIVPTLQN